MLNQAKTVKNIPEHAGKKARGASELKKYQGGIRLTPRQMILAKCYDCMGGYSDGKLDCRIKECPLYPIFPYKS